MAPRHEQHLVTDHENRRSSGCRPAEWVPTSEYTFWAAEGTLRVAEEHIDEAVGILQACGAKFYLDQVIAKKENLRA